MSKLSGLTREDKKRQFVAKSTIYQSGTKKAKSRMLTFTLTEKYLELINDLARKDRLSKSELIRASITSFARLTKEDREKIYIEIHKN